jgi:glycosyltransferase involved in cell wall biosynthesis
MKIAISLPYFPGYNTGTGNAVRNLAKGLIFAGCKVDIIAEKKFSKINSSDELKKNIKILNTKVNWPYQLDKKVYSRDLLNYDLVILNGNFVIFNFFLSRLLIKKNIPYVFFPHTDYSYHQLKKNYFIKKIYFWFFESKVIRKSLSTILFLNRQKPPFFKILGSKTRVIIMPNSIDLTKFTNAKKKQNYKKITKLLFLGRRDIYSKGIDNLIKALSKKENRSYFKISFYGRDIGQDKEIVSLMKKSGVRYQINKHIDGEIFKLYKEHDCLILPSRAESFSMAALESIAYGFPVAITNSAGISKHISKGNCGILFTASVKGISNALKKLKLMNVNQIKDKSNKGVIYIKKNLECKTVGKNLYKDLKRLLNFKI